MTKFIIQYKFLDGPWCDSLVFKNSDTFEEAEKIIIDNYGYFDFSWTKYRILERTETVIKEYIHDGF